MAHKVYQTKEAFGHFVKVHRIDGEYRARLYRFGEADPESDYFTDSKEDAIGTADCMLDHALGKAVSRRN